MLRFLVDENVPVQIGHLLRGQGHDVLIVCESAFVRATDPEIWAIAVRQKRIVVTHDKDFPIHGAVGLPSGVILIRPRDSRPGAIEALFREFWARVSPAELLGRVVSVQPGRYRTRRL